MSARGAGRAGRAERTGRSRAPVPALLLEGAAKAYGDLPALEPTDLVVPAGQLVALVGHNGSGKSTLLGLGAGVAEPTEGRVRVYGEDPGSLAARRRVSYLPDTPVLYDDLTVREHLQYISRLHGGAGNDPRHDQLLERLGLADRADDLPSRFSRGLRQKAAVAVAFSRPFGLLLVDEPFVGLDEDGRVALLALLDEAVAGGAAAVVATHDQAAVGSFHRCVALRDGRLETDDTGPATSRGRLERPERNTR